MASIKSRLTSVWGKRPESTCHRGAFSYETCSSSGCSDFTQKIRRFCETLVGFDAAPCFQKQYLHFYFWISVELLIPTVLLDGPLTTFSKQIYNVKDFSVR